MPRSAASLRGAPLSSGDFAASRSNGSFNWATSGAALAGGQSATFEVEAGQGHTEQPVKWTTTSDGNNDPANGVVDSGPAEDDTSPVRGPVVLASIDLAADAVARVGASCSLLIASNLRDVAYTVHATIAKPAESLTDADFAAFVQTQAVPAAWGLTFAGLAGRTSSENGAASTVVGIPNSQALAGQHLWLILAIPVQEGNCDFVRAHSTELIIEN